MKNVKIIANYLPQYHVIEENNKWWGDGFTDWVATKTAKPLFENHREPRIPLNNNYYSLDDVNAIRWQANLARKYGIYGFGIYHYWFSSNQNLLYKPVEILLNNKDIDINYMLIWDNSSWKRTWKKEKFANDWAPKFDNDLEKENNNGILAELIYGNEDEWKIHFEYLLKFFKDKRYIKIDNKPVFAFYQPNNDFETVKRMSNYWDKLAKDNGFNGIICAMRENYKKNHLEYKLRYSPLSPEYFINKIKYKIKDIIADKTGKIRFYNYDKCWKEILSNAKKSDEKTFLSGFVDFDDTPRRANKGRVMKGATPEKFGKYIEKLAKIAKEKNQEYLFVTAWNEWAEGAYLEPDTVNGYAYLEQLKIAIEKVNKS